MADSAALKSTISSLLHRYQLKREDCNKKVSDRHLEEISSSHCGKWRSLPAYLDMKTINMEDTDRDPGNEEEKRSAFFRKWRHMKGSAATYMKLIGALLEIKCMEDAESVCKLIQHSTGMHLAGLVPLDGEKESLQCMCMPFASFAMTFWIAHGHDS